MLNTRNKYGISAHYVLFSISTDGGPVQSPLTEPPPPEMQVLRSSM